MFIPLANLLKLNKISERGIAQKSGISRLTLRSLLRLGHDSRLGTWGRVARALGFRVALAWENPQTKTDFSVQGACHFILRDGFESWKIHLMDFVDEFRRTQDTRLILIPPLSELDLRLRALLASSVSTLCRESGIEVPHWARATFLLEKPWFVSESDALKAMLLRESPLEFRRNQIFVFSNFLERI